MFKFSKNLNLTKNKSIEIELELFDSSIDDFFDLRVVWTRKQDHAGPSFTFSIFKIIFFNVKIYDHRHFNYDHDCWEDHSD